MSPREDAKAIFDSALDAIAPQRLINDACSLESDLLRINGRRYDLNAYDRVFVFGSGKAAWPMAQAIETLLQERITAGLIVVPQKTGPLQRIDIVEGSHPIPSEKSLKSARALRTMMQSCREEDLYLYLLSGGSSALIEEPLDPISLDELQEVTMLLLRHHLDITEVNAVRKHLSRIKGGRLGRLCKAEGAVLVISDVIGDDLEVIGSAPLYYDKTTYAQTKELLEKKKLFDTLPASVRYVLFNGCSGEIEESPKEPSSRISHFLIGSNATALEAAREKALSLGYDAMIIQEPLQGSADVTGASLVEQARKLPDRSKPLCLIYGGETTVKVKGNGVGGRNQQLCLSALSTLKENDRIVLLCAGTDGLDGNSDAAGAVVDAATTEKAATAGLDPQSFLDNNDANHFFRLTGDLLTTGPTGTNVMDITIVIKEGEL
jgi:glycerate 2-kinase